MVEIKNSPIKWIMVTLSILLIGYSFLLYTHRPIKTEIMPVLFTVGDSVGIDIDSSQLNFGRILPGGVAVRNVIINNSFNYPVRLDVYISSKVRDYVTSEKNNLIVSANSEEKISFYLSIPPDTELGNYSGIIQFDFRKYRS